MKVVEQQLGPRVLTKSQSKKGGRVVVKASKPKKTKKGAPHVFVHSMHRMSHGQSLPPHIAKVVDSLVANIVKEFEGYPTMVLHGIISECFKETMDSIFDLWGEDWYQPQYALQEPKAMEDYDCIIFDEKMEVGLHSLTLAIQELVEDYRSW